MASSYYRPGEPIPCDTCENRKACKANEMSCDAFNSYCSSGAVKIVGADIFHPNREIMGKLTAGDLRRSRGNRRRLAAG